MKTKIRARLQEARKAAGISLEEMANHGFAASKVSRIENGKQSLNIDELIDLAEIYGVNFLDIVDPDRERPVTPDDQADLVLAAGEAIARLTKRRGEVSTAKGVAKQIYAVMKYIESTPDLLEAARRGEKIDLSSIKFLLDLQ